MESLGKTERCAYSDRLGRGNLKNPQEQLNAYPLENGWESVLGFQLDLSGVTRARCDKDGFTYSLDCIVFIFFFL
jgi:hypothetical protein